MTYTIYTVPLQYDIRYIRNMTCLINDTHMTHVIYVNHMTFVIDASKHTYTKLSVERNFNYELIDRIIINGSFHAFKRCNAARFHTYTFAPYISTKISKRNKPKPHTVH